MCVCVCVYFFNRVEVKAMDIRVFLVKESPTVVDSCSGVSVSSQSPCPNQVK